MKLIFLGTGTSQGVPVIGSQLPVSQSCDERDKRTRSSVLISWENVNILIDCGPDFRQQMLRHQVSHLEGILFTHEHADHTAGIDDIRPFVHRQGAMNIYGSHRVLENLKHRFSYIFDEENPYPGAPRVVSHRVSETPFFIGNQKIVPLNVLHGKLPILGYLIGNLAYITDAKSIAEQEIEKIKNIKTLIINCLRGEKEHHSHLILPEAMEFIRKINPEETFFTHISEDWGFHQEISDKLPPNVFLAYDGLCLSI